MIKTNALKIKVCFFAIIFIPFLTTCDIQKSVDPINMQARIIPGSSVDGICLGNYLETAEEILGTATYYGSGDGLRSWTYYHWPNTDYEGLSVGFIVTIDNRGGPADYLEVIAPYNGTTYEGIGIGTHMQDVFRAWGDPEILNDNSPYSIGYTYCFEETRFYLNFRDSLVKFISMGPFIPYPGITICK